MTTITRARMAPALALVAALAWPAGAQAAPSANSTAKITGAFGASCTDFAAHSSKDISHVEIHYGDGRVVKDEAIDSPDVALDGTAADAIASAIVKSGTTAEWFDCDPDPIAACSDGVDNDGNGLTDYPDDPGCASSDDDEELSDNGDGFD